MRVLELKQRGGLQLVGRPGVSGVVRIEEVQSEEEKNMHIVNVLKKPVASVGVQAVVGVREATTGRVMHLVPRIWAVADAAVVTPVAPVKAAGAAVPRPELAFYRKYTEALLRRYLRMSTEAGRVPSLLGREMFRGNVSSYKVRSFEDVVIFCHDVEKCFRVLNEMERDLIRRIAIQCYSQGEAAGILGISMRSCVRQYADAVDKLTRELLRLDLLRPLESCQ